MKPLRKTKSDRAPLPAKARAPFRLEKLEERIAPKGGKPSRGCLSGDPGTAVCYGPY